MKGFVIDPLIRGLTGVRPRLSVRLPSLVSLLLSILVLFLAWSGLLYPLRPDVWSALDHPLTADPLLANAWGGPTLIGAWLVHAMVALGLQTVCLWIIRVLNRRAAGACCKKAGRRPRRPPSAPCRRHAVAVAGHLPGITRPCPVTALPAQLRSAQSRNKLAASRERTA